MVLKSDPENYETLHSKFLIWIFWGRDCECWLSDYILSDRAERVLMERAMTPVITDNIDREDIHLIQGIDDRLDKVEDILDAIIPGRI